MPAEKQPLTWLITGCSNGIGLALARHVLASGDNLIATSRTPSKTPSLVAEVESSPRGRWMALDVSWPADQIDAAIQAANALTFHNKDTDSGGGIDVVVNNAAYAALGAVEDLAEDQARAQFDTNFWGSVRVCKAVLPLMRSRGRASTIVNVSSILGFTTGPAYSMYSASKFALQGFSQALAAEAEPFGIRVVIVELGAFRTGFLAGGALQMAAPSPAYEAPHPVGVCLEKERANDGQQPGDPDKAVRAIHDAVTGREEHLSKVRYLVLGGDSFQAGMAQLDRLRNDWEACKDVAFGVQFPEEMLNSSWGGVEGHREVEH